MRRSRPLLASCTVLALGCSSDAPDPAGPPELVRLTAAVRTVAVDGELGVAVTATDAAGRAVDPRALTWTSSDPSVATVSARGVVTGRFPGRTVIGASGGARSDTLTITVLPIELGTLGLGAAHERYTAEVWVRGPWAYTTTWGNRGGRPGNAIEVWNITGPVPVLVDSVIVTDATGTGAGAASGASADAGPAGTLVSTLGDVQAADDGSILVVATERTPGAIVVFDLSDPAKPRPIARHATDNTFRGVHTAELARVNGRLHAFLSVDPPEPRLVIVDLDDPQRPREVLVRRMGSPSQHDVFVRDGLLFTASWNEGMTIWDVGGAHGGSVADPRRLGNVQTVGGAVHNIWWAHDSATGAARYAFVGEEGDGDIGSSSSGDIHVVDVSDPASPREVAFYHVPGAGPHNFSVNERLGVLYAAFYNGGVRALDIRGDLGSCSAAERATDGRCDLALMGREVASWRGGPGAVFIWGVHQVGGRVYASDMLNGLWALDAGKLRR